MVEYVSRYHTPDDPGGLIREVLEMGAAFPGPAPDLLLSWVLRLEADADPGAVAKRLLVDYAVADGPPPDNACGELITLLREVAQFGVGRLHGAVKPKRRGGWRGKRRD